MDEISQHLLRDGDTEITVLSMGCAIMDWQVRGRSVVLGYAEPEHYRKNPASMGVVCGRVINRIANARFVLDGVTYALPANAWPHHLHGGPNGLSRRNWDVARINDRALRLSCVSEDGDQGYPGRVRVSVLLTLSGARLTWDMEAFPDRVTPINLGQHLYFNLMGAGTVRDHVLTIAADRYTPNGADLVPDGRIMAVDGTAYDFRAGQRLGDGAGWDGNVVLTPDAAVAASVTVPDGMRLRLWTDRPGLQVYTSNTLAQSLPKGRGAAHGPFAGLCLEAQDLPNAINVPAFGSVLCSPDAPYRQVTSIEIT